MPLSMIRATGLLVFLAKLLAATTLPLTMWSRIMFMKLVSILAALRMAISRSAKTYTATSNIIASGIIIQPPIFNSSKKLKWPSWFVSPATACVAFVKESTICKRSIIINPIRGIKVMYVLKRHYSVFQQS